MSDLTTKPVTLAMIIAELLDNDGERFKSSDGRTLDQLARSAGARVYRVAECIRYALPDESALVECGAC